MKRIWESIASIAVTGFALYMLFELIRPYAIIIVLVIALGIIGERFYVRMRRG